jgi:hypothetical protein
MLRQLRSIAGLTLVGLVAVAACGDDAPNSSNGKGGEPSDGGEGGAGNAASKGGSSAKGGSGGKGGTASKGGSSAKGGSGGKGGTDSAGGASGAAGASAQCPACESGFCLDDGTCVDCLPTDDACPSGSYCTDENTCAPGCKPSGDGCASGVCDETHNCSNCINDDECIDDLVCGNGQCGASCTQAQEGQQASCGDGLTCCSLHCTDVEIDSNHCGACGATCGDGEFCGIDACADTGQGGAGGAGNAPCVACHPVTLANICAIANAIVILDSNVNETEGNRTPGRAIGAALRDKCVPQPALSEAEQDSVEALNITTGRPVSGGKELLIVAGGAFYQHLEGYLEAQRIAPLYLNVTDTDTQFLKSSNNQEVVSLPIAGPHDTSDYFLIQFMRDPASGSLALNAQGFWLSGTNAAAYQLIEAILPNLASFDKAWYAYEWTDADGDKAPDLNEMVLKASGL